jgi:serine/threonine-protein kinase HipA
MSDIEVHIERDGTTIQIGLARINRARGNETVVFEYSDTWLSDPRRFALEPALPLTRGGFAPSVGQSLFGAIGDSAPDTWGRRLMQRAERRAAQHQGRSVRTLMESDYLLGVTDLTRMKGRFWRKILEVYRRSSTSVVCCNPVIAFCVMKKAMKTYK